MEPKVSEPASGSQAPAAARRHPPNSSAAIKRPKVVDPILGIPYVVTWHPQAHIPRYILYERRRSYMSRRSRPATWPAGA